MPIASPNYIDGYLRNGVSDDLGIVDQRSRRMGQSAPNDHFKKLTKRFLNPYISTY